MAPLLDDHNGGLHNANGSPTLCRVAIIGAGSRGNAYAAATIASGLGIVVAVVEPIDFKRNLLGSKYIWKGRKPSTGEAFKDWRGFIESQRQRNADAAGSHASTSRPRVDAVFVCVRDELHAEVVTALAPLNLHLMCEKPLATTLQDCLRIQKALQSYPQKIFAIGHVLRYSPHNLLLRDLVLNRKVIGDVLSIEHTEPVGWWHFAHSYVRGNWRKESYTAPSLLTKSCHDIDWLLWMLCSPPPGTDRLAPHLPTTISSTGTLNLFRKSRKPVAAGSATNCLSCPLQNTCLYSAKRIYHDRHLLKAKNTDWPVDIVNPEIETIHSTQGPAAAQEALLTSLAEDYDTSTTPIFDIESRPWFGRCVWESDNNVCDDQHVLLTWEDEDAAHPARKAKTASFHMIASTLAQCERRGRIYGSTGEISYDSSRITVHDFTNDETRRFAPEVPKHSHHGGGDQGLTEQFLKAVGAVESGAMRIGEAQGEFLGVSVEEAVRSHAVVFAAEEARKTGRVVGWREWWDGVQAKMG